MRRQWSGKNVDLALLGKHIEDFFKSKDYNTRKDRVAGEYAILLIADVGHDEWGYPAVRIFGNEEDFTIEFMATERMRSSVIRWLS